jgi:hypothetical protein
MAAQTKCLFCDHPFEFDNSTGSLLATCPHCGKQNTGVASAGMTQRLHILRDAPSLVAGKPCPKCKGPMAIDDSVCIHCGYNLATHQRVKGSRRSSGRKAWLLLGGSVLLLIAAAAIRARPPAPPEAPPDEDVRADFDGHKIRAEQEFRRKLDETAPGYEPNDPIELRRNNGQVVRGALVRCAGQGTNRTAILATEEGKVVVPVCGVDPDARIRLDPDYREQYIRQRLTIPSSASPPRDTPGTP